MWWFSNSCEFRTVRRITPYESFSFLFVVWHREFKDLMCHWSWQGRVLKLRCSRLKVSLAPSGNHSGLFPCQFLINPCGLRLISSFTHTYHIYFAIKLKPTLNNLIWAWVLWSGYERLNSAMTEDDQRCWDRSVLNLLADLIWNTSSNISIVYDKSIWYRIAETTFIEAGKNWMRCTAWQLSVVCTWAAIFFADK